MPHAPLPDCLASQTTREARQLAANIYDRVYCQPGGAHGQHEPERFYYAVQRFLKEIDEIEAEAMD